MRQVEAYLSRRAQAQWPGAMVYREDDERIVLERPGAEPLLLGVVFPAAKQALHALVNAARASGGEPGRI